MSTSGKMYMSQPVYMSIWLTLTWTYRIAVSLLMTQYHYSCITSHTIVSMHIVTVRLGSYFCSAPYITAIYDNCNEIEHSPKLWAEDQWHL